MTTPPEDPDPDAPPFENPLRDADGNVIRSGHNTNNVPANGDPEILPKGTLTRFSRERLPFRGGKDVPPGPWPPDFLDDSDLPKHFGNPKFPTSRYFRRRGEEWTTAAQRAVLLAFISRFVKSRDWAFDWQLVERGSMIQQTVLRKRDSRARLAPFVIFRITASDGAIHETSIDFPDVGDTGVGGTITQARLDLVAATLDALHG